MKNKNNPDHLEFRISVPYDAGEIQRRLEAVTGKTETGLQVLKRESFTYDGNLLPNGFRMERIKYVSKFDSNRKFTPQLVGNYVDTAEGTDIVVTTKFRLLIHDRIAAFLVSRRSPIFGLIPIIVFIFLSSSWLVATIAVLGIVTVIAAIIITVIKNLKSTISTEFEEDRVRLTRILQA